LSSLSPLAEIVKESAMIPAVMVRIPTPSVICVAFLTVAATPGAAQVITGMLEGRVIDTSGAVLPGVTIAATNTATAATSTVATTREGFYRVPYLPSGAYDVRADLSGFRAETKQGVTVRVNDSAVVDFTLSVSPVSETITVQAAPSADADHEVGAQTHL
jgi:hypothetical protein